MVKENGPNTDADAGRRWRAMGAALLCGAVERRAGGRPRLQPIVATLILMVAGRGLAQLLTDGQIVTVYYEPFFFLGSGYLFGLPFSLYVVAAVFIVTAADAQDRARPVHPGGRHQSGGGAPGRPAHGLADLLRLRVLQRLRRPGGLMITSNIKSADANNAGLLLELDAILAVTLGGTSLAGGKFSLAGSMIGALIIQTLTYTIYSLGVPPEVNMVVKSVVVFLVCCRSRAEFLRKLLKNRRTA
jgi:ribose/xylose/arabinose/galactoside ABC-type transport system permease subunit